MFETRRSEGLGAACAGFLFLVYHNTVRGIRKGHGNAVVALGRDILQSVGTIAAFYLLYSLTGFRDMALRGDFLLYLMSGVFLFFTHVRAISAVMGAEGPASPMMQHLPMNTTIAIAAAALGALYIQIVSVALILLVYHLAVAPVVVAEPVGALAMLLLAWASGVAIGLLFLAAKPWAPGLAQAGAVAFQRVNMIASGKMFVANTLPGYMLFMFDWNPLFHAIDQGRGFIFVNYTPHFSSLAYPALVTLVCLCLGLMGEFCTRRRASLSWSARR